MISVCMPTYNGELFIKEQISSILDQLDFEDELVISDDGSLDNTLKIIDTFGDKRIKLIRHNPDRVSLHYKFSLTTNNIENALIHAKGDIIFLADQDDIWKPNKVRVIKESLLKSDLVLHDCIIIDKEGKTLIDSYFRFNNSRVGILHNMISNSYLGCCIAFKRHLLSVILPFPEKPVPHDIWIGLLAEFYGKVSLIEDKLIAYRRHDTNLSSSSQKSERSFFRKIEYRFLILISLIKRIITTKV